MKRLFLILPILFFMFSCENGEPTQVTQSDTLKITSENLLNAVAWFQHSAEMEACYYQAFNQAQTQLLTNIKNATTDLPKAVVVDIDETMLDNSPFEGYLIQKNLEYTKDLWNEWVQLGAAEALPGALEFSKFAEQNDVAIIYVSNRSVNNLEPTIKNLVEKGFPYSDAEHIFLKDSTSDKTVRRELISQKYEIIMLIGDNLRDFDEIYKERDQNYGKDLVAKDASLWGTKYIIIPNPMYGEWTKAYNNPSGETTYDQMLQNMKKMLEGF